MLIPYYVRKRLTDIVISIFMLAFLALTLLPIGWMIFSSLKDSTDIAIGRVGLRRASSNVIQLELQPNQLLALTANGEINQLDPGNLERVGGAAYNTRASAFWLDSEHIWLASADRGLVRVERTDPRQARFFPLPAVKRVDFSKVQTMFIKGEGENIYVSLDYPGFGGVWRFDAASLSFKEYLNGRKNEIFPAAVRLVPFSVPRQIGGEILAQVSSEAGAAFYGASDGKVYKYDLAGNKLLAQARMPKGRLLVRFGNYLDMWKNVNFGLYLKNSIIICGFTMVFSMIFATLAAYALSRFRFPGSDLFSNTVLATQMIPMIMYLIPIYIMFVKLTMLTGIQVKGTYFGMVLIYSAWFIPFSIWILRGFFASIPRELEEAALIDGCSRFAVFWRIALPLAMPGIIATGIYTFLNAWDELMFAWVLTNSDTMTIPVGIRLFVGNYQNRFDLMMAAAVVATLPVVVLFFLLQRHIVKGLTAGAVKG